MKIKLLFGKKAEHNCFGLFSLSDGVYSGGFKKYIFGIKNLFNLCYFIGWGSYKN
jgi:hypothetical protein